MDIDSHVAVSVLGTLGWEQLLTDVLASARAMGSCTPAFSERALHNIYLESPWPVITSNVQRIIGYFGVDWPSTSGYLAFQVEMIS